LAGDANFIYSISKKNHNFVFNEYIELGIISPDSRHFVFLKFLSDL